MNCITVIGSGFGRPAGGAPAAAAGWRAGRQGLAGVRMGGSFLWLGVCMVVFAGTPQSNLRAKPDPFSPDAVFSYGHADNTNLYDAPVPGFVGPAGEGISNPSGGAPIVPWRPPSLPGDVDYVEGEANYVNPLFLGWADTVVEYEEASNVSKEWLYSGDALGPVTGRVGDAVSLGDLTRTDLANGKPPGFLIVSFERPIYDAPGADIVVFENGFPAGRDDPNLGIVLGEMFAELAYVEVSSDGDTFLGFPSVSRTPNPVGAYGTLQPRNVYNLLGKHSNSYGLSWGTPFDLAELRGLPGTGPGEAVDLNNIRYVKIVDIPGSGDFSDSLGNPIYDAWVTQGSGGADVEAIGAISQPHYYADWLVQQNTPKPEDNPEEFLPVGAPEEDFDGDGIPNALEFLLALDPRVAEPSDQLEFHWDFVADAYTLNFRRDVRVADYRLVLERASSRNRQWEPVLTLGPMNAEERSPAVRSVSSVSLLPQASLGVIRRYEVLVERAEQGTLPAEFFRLRAEPVAETP